MGERTIRVLKPGVISSARRRSQNSITHLTRSLYTPYDDIIRFQRTIGNHTVQRVFALRYLQAKGEIGKKNDGHEQEVDRLAEPVMNVREPNVEQKTSLPFTSGSLLSVESVQAKKLLSTIRQITLKKPLGEQGDIGQQVSVDEKMSVIQRYKYGSDGPIPEKYRSKISAADYNIKSLIESPGFILRFSGFVKKYPFLKNISLAKFKKSYQEMTLHLAETSTNPKIISELQQERFLPGGEGGITIVGTPNAYLFDDSLKQSIDAITNLLFHEVWHVAGVPMGQKIFFPLIEPTLHGFESEVGYPLWIGGAKIKPIPDQPSDFGTLKIQYVITGMDDEEKLPLPENTRLEILDQFRNIIFVAENIHRDRGNYWIDWNGKDLKGRKIYGGIFTVRIVSSDGLHDSAHFKLGPFESREDLRG